MECKQMINSLENYSYLIDVSEAINRGKKKMNSGLFKNIIKKMCREIIYLIYKNDLALNNLQGFIIFTNPLRLGRIWHKVNFLSGL